MNPNKSLRIAYLLWLFTGVFGGHRWYLGKRWSALPLLILSTYFLYLTIPDGNVGELLYTIFSSPLRPIFGILGTPENHYLHNFNLPEKIEFVLIAIFIPWSVTLTLAFDLFWIYIKVKKQLNAITQQQVEAFD